HPLGLAGVMALDRLGNAGVNAPAPGEHAADQRMVDAELATLLGDPVVGRSGPAVEALGVTGMQPREDGPADVVKDRGEGELVAVSDPADLRDPVRRPLHLKGVQPEAVRGEGEPSVAVEDVVGRGRAQDCLHRARAEPLDTLGDAEDPAATLKLSRRPDYRAREAAVGLDNRCDLVRRGAPIDLLERGLAALLQGRLALGLVEGRGEHTPASLTPGRALGAPC